MRLCRRTCGKACLTARLFLNRPREANRGGQRTHDYINYGMLFLKHRLVTALLLLFITGAPGASLITTSSDVTLSQPLTIRWRYDSPFTLNLTPASDVDRIYLPLANGTIVALRAKDGQLYWRSEMGGELSASPVADDLAVYVASEMKPDITKPAPGERRAMGTLRALGRDGGCHEVDANPGLPAAGQSCD